jgi:hypothetical protein
VVAIALRTVKKKSAITFGVIHIIYGAYTFASILPTATALIAIRRHSRTAPHVVVIALRSLYYCVCRCGATTR